MQPLHSIYASAVAATVTIVTVTSVTIWADLAPPVKAWLAALTGHHWVTKSWLSLGLFWVLFGVLYWVTKGVAARRVHRALLTLEVVSLVSAMSLLGFFVYEFVNR